MTGNAVLAVAAGLFLEFKPGIDIILEESGDSVVNIVDLINVQRSVAFLKGQLDFGIYHVLVRARYGSECRH